MICGRKRKSGDPLVYHILGKILNTHNSATLLSKESYGKWDNKTVTRDVYNRQKYDFKVNLLNLFGIAHTEVFERVEKRWRQNILTDIKNWVIQGYPKSWAGFPKSLERRIGTAKIIYVKKWRKRTQTNLFWYCHEILNNIWTTK